MSPSDHATAKVGKYRPESLARMVLRAYVPFLPAIIFRRRRQQWKKSPRASESGRLLGSHDGRSRCHSPGHRRPSCARWCAGPRTGPPSRLVATTEPAPGSRSVHPGHGPAFLVVEVHGEPGAVVLQHGADDVSIAGGGPPLVVILLPHDFGVTAVPGVGSALMTRSGISGWAKKNQCHHAVANRASARVRCSLRGGRPGTPLGSLRRGGPGPGGGPRRPPVVADETEALVAERLHDLDHVLATARLECGT